MKYLIYHQNTISIAISAVLLANRIKKQEVYLSSTQVVWLGTLITNYPRKFIKLRNQLHTTLNRYGGIREQTKRQTDSTSSYFRGSIFCRSCTYINPVIVVISCVNNQKYEIDLTLMNPRFSPHLLSLFCHYSIPFFLAHSSKFGSQMGLAYVLF